MIINTSAVALHSNRSFLNFSHVEKESMNMRQSDAAMLDLSDESKTLLEQLREKKKEQKAQGENRLSVSVIDMSQETHNSAWASSKMEDRTQLKLELLLKLMEALSGKRSEKLEDLTEQILEGSDGTVSARAHNSSGWRLGGIAASGIAGVTGADQPAPSKGGNAMVMTRVTASNVTVLDQEAVAFAGTGMVQTKDGRSISFQVEMGMSRSFAAQFESLEKEDYFLVDPLVVNLGVDVAEISDQKFFFDLDGDGRQEEVSNLKEGSGFLALDKNRDGKINDGSELFGTKSGNGFEELAAYDEDGNGWIDEADRVFGQLKIWTRNEDGTDTLIGIRDAGIGAIYLGSTDTQFHYKDEGMKTNGVLQSTGIYLRENGQAGTIQHIDFAV